MDQARIVIANFFEFKFLTILYPLTHQTSSLVPKINHALLKFISFSQILLFAIHYVTLHQYLDTYPYHK